MRELSSDFIRAFVALDIPGEVRQEISGAMSRLKETGADVKWVRPENLHLTLKFLGKTSRRDLRSVKAFLQGIADSEEGFSIRLAGMGAFPDSQRPRVIWIGMGEGKDRLAAIASRVESEAVRSGFPQEERPFSGHLTLGRLRSMKGIGRLTACLESMTFSSAYKIEIRQIHLYQSTLTPGGPLYEKLETVHLK